MERRKRVSKRERGRREKGREKEYGESKEERRERGSR